MHVIVLRYCPSFVDAPNLVMGQHEVVEKEINRRAYKLDSVREGYCIPFASEIKLLDYRIKKECAAEFLRDLRCQNLHSAKNPITLWKFLFKSQKHGTFGIGKKVLFVSMLFYYAHRFGLWLHPFDAADGKPEGFGKDSWCYNFFIGVLPDVETKFGEEL